MIAIVPAAGQGVRMASVTRGKPKELLPLGSKSVLHRLLDEIRSCDPDAVVIVNSPNKPEIQDAVSELSQGPFADLPVQIAIQHTQNGLAGAVAAANVEDDAMVFVADGLFAGPSPAVRMSSLLYRGIDGCVAVETVPDAQVSQFGIVEIDEGIGAIHRILEKPKLTETPSRWAVAGRFGFSKPVMGFLGEYVAAHDTGDREITLSDVIAAGIVQGIDFRAVPLEPGSARLDCGNPDGYALALRQRWD